MVKRTINIRVSFVSRFKQDRQLSFTTTGKEKARLFEASSRINSLPRTQEIKFVDINVVEPAHLHRVKNQSVVQEPPLDTGPRTINEANSRQILTEIDDIDFDKVFQDPFTDFMAYGFQDDSRSQPESDLSYPFIVG